MLRWLCLELRALQQLGILIRSGFYYLADVGFLDILLEYQVSWWKDSTQTAIETTAGSFDLCLHVRGDKSQQGLETGRHRHS